MLLEVEAKVSDDVLINCLVVMIQGPRSGVRTSVCCSSRSRKMKMLSVLIEKTETLKSLDLSLATCIYLKKTKIKQKNKLNQEKIEV